MPHVEFLITWIIIILIIMEAVLEQREKTLSEIAHDVYTETGSYFVVASIFCFLKLKRLSLKKVCLIWSSLSRLRR